MLTHKEIRDIAIKYLQSNGYPIIEESCRIVFPHEREDQESREFMIEYNVACVSFDSNFDPDDPYKDILPYAFILYVNITTGEVTMPRHM